MRAPGCSGRDVGAIARDAFTAAASGRLAMLVPEPVSSRATAHSQPQPRPPLVADSSTRNLGLRILGVWLLLWALFRFVDLSFAYDHLVLPILGLVAGLLLIIGS